MAAPTEVLTTGTASLFVVSHEPAITSTVKVDEITFKSARNRVEIQNVNQTVVRVKRTNPILTISFSGERTLTSGLAVEGPGEVIASLANFGASYRDFDNTVGELILGDPEDKVGFIEDRPMTSFDITHYPYVEA